MTKKIAQYGMFVALAIVFSYIERLIPVPVPIPGVKLGLANIVVVLFLYLHGWKPALLLSVLRIVVVGFMFGNLWGACFSLAGGLVSFGAMVLGKRLGCFSVVGVSVAGGAGHNIGQMAVGIFVVGKVTAFYYLPYLMLAGMATGVLIGVTSWYVLQHVGKLKI